MVDDVDNDGGKEAQTTRTVEITVPRFLEEGRNFFEYPPFGNAIAIASSSSGIDENHFRRMLHYASTDRETWAEPRLGTGPEVIPRLADFVREKITPRPPREETTKSIRELLKILGEYPDWDDYLRANCTKVNYRTDGSFRSRSGKFVPNPSYPEWLSQKIQRDKKLRAAQISVVLVETFPQQLAGQTLSEALRQAGGNPPGRWRVVKGSGIPGGPR